MNHELIDKIVSLYESKLEIPVEKPKHQYLLCPVGLVGAGKTTVVKPLSKKLSLVRLSNDEVRKIIYDLTATVTLEEFTEIMTRFFKKYLQEGYSIALDGDCASTITQRLISERQKEFNLKVIWIYVNPPESFIINKLKGYQHTWLFKDGKEAINNYMGRKSVHENLTMPFIYTFDTSASNLETQIEQAFNLIKKEVD